MADPVPQFKIQRDETVNNMTVTDHVSTLELAVDHGLTADASGIILAPNIIAGDASSGSVKTKVIGGPGVIATIITSAVSENSLIFVTVQGSTLPVANNVLRVSRRNPALLPAPFTGFDIRSSVLEPSSLTIAWLVVN